MLEKDENQHVMRLLETQKAILDEKVRMFGNFDPKEAQIHSCKLSLLRYWNNTLIFSGMEVKTLTTLTMTI